MKGGREKRKPSEERPVGLPEEYDFLLTASYALGIPFPTGKILKDVIDQHPEYRGTDPGEEIRTGNGSTMNPRIHVAIEAAVENQITRNDPPEAREAYLKLINQGVDAHEARHEVGRIFLDVVWHIVNRRLTDDPINVYRSHLLDLIRRGPF
jgi:hypothetical protein